MTDNNVINFPRIGFNLNPTNTTATTVIEPPNTPQPAPTPAPDPSPRTGRRSPLDTLAALPTPGVREPVIPTPTAAPTAGTVPAAFRSDNGDPHSDLIGPRLGALSLAAILAVAVAALRGAHTVTSTWWENRQAKQAETDKLREARLKHQLAMQNIGDKAAQQRAKQRVPSSNEFGRKSLGRNGNGSGSGKGRKNNSGTSTGPKNSSKGPRGPKNSSPNHKTNSGSLRKNSGGNGGKNDRTRTPKPLRDRRGPGAPKTPKIRNPKSRTQRNSNSPGGTLTKSGPNAVERRLKNRRKNPSTPALWRNNDHRKPTKTKTPKTPKNSKTPDTKGTDRKGTTLPDKLRKNRLKKASGWTGGWWTTSKRRPKSPDTNTTRPRTNKRPKSRDNRQEKTRRGSSWKDCWNKARAYSRAKTARTDRTTTPRPGPGPGTTGPTPGAAGGTYTPRGGRRSPFENAGHAAAQSEGVTYTVVSEHIPGSSRPKPRTPAAAVTTGPAALNPASTPHTTRPGTSRPKEPIAMPPTPGRPNPRIQKARTEAARTATHAVGRQMDAQHATEITLDDACDAADKLAGDAFKAHDESRRLADKARDLRDTWLQFADDLATNHNLIGPLFTAAAIGFAESMDLVARMADEMETASLNAAEKAETAGNELNDAYRPYNKATADAGLTTPSAPIHNHA